MMLGAGGRRPWVRLVRLRLFLWTVAARPTTSGPLPIVLIVFLPGSNNAVFARLPSAGVRTLVALVVLRSCPWLPAFFLLHLSARLLPSEQYDS